MNLSDLTKPTFEDLGQDFTQMFEDGKKSELYTSIESESDTVEQYPNPDEIEVTLPEVEPLKEDMLPDVFKKFLVDQSTVLSSPVDFMTSFLITVCGQVIGTRCSIKPQAYSPWMVTPNLWGGIVAPPSAMKTANLKPVLRLLAPLERKAQEIFKEARSDFQVEEAILSARIKLLNDSLKKDPDTFTDSDKEKLKSLMDEKETKTPTMTRYKANDATIEKLADLLVDNPNGMIVFKDELTGLLKSWDKPGHETDRSFYLEAWNGDGSYEVDRIARGSTRIEKLCLSLFGGIQPDKLIAYLNMLDHGDNDGMLQRFQMLVYPDPVKYKVPSRTIDTKLSTYAENTLMALAEMNFTLLGARTNTAMNDVPFFEFDDDAQSLFDEWMNHLMNKKLNSDDYNPYFKQHLSKYRSLIPSLALIFHCLDCTVDPSIQRPKIDDKTLFKAIKWGDYLESHANRIYNGLGIKNDSGAIHLSKKILSKSIDSPFSVRELYRRNWHLLNDKKKAERAISILVENGWLTPVLNPGTISGRPPSQAYKINPKVYL